MFEKEVNFSEFATKIYFGGIQNTNGSTSGVSLD